MFISQWSQPGHFVKQFLICLVKVWQRSHKGQSIAAHQIHGAIGWTILGIILTETMQIWFQLQIKYSLNISIYYYILPAYTLADPKLSSYCSAGNFWYLVLPFQLGVSERQSCAEKLHSPCLCRINGAKMVPSVPRKRLHLSLVFVCCHTCSSSSPLNAST